MVSRMNVTYRNELAIASLILGILSFLLLASAIALFVINFSSVNKSLNPSTILIAGFEMIFALPSLVTGIISLKQPGRRKNSAVAGITFGALGVGATLGLICSDLFLIV